MSGAQRDEPYNEFIEEVLIGTTCQSAAVKLTLDSRTGKFDAINGRVAGQTPQRVNRSTPTTVTVVSNAGSTYVVKRRTGGDYHAESWLTWVNRVQ